MTSPAPIKYLYDRIKKEYPDAELGGIYANKPGYHNAPINLPPSDYSVKLPEDKGFNPNYGSALDVTLRDVDDLAKLTQRLIDLTKAKNPAMQALREFYGSLDGKKVVGMNVDTGNAAVSTDSTHLWHCHVSVHRKYCNNQAAMKNLADAILGDDEVSAQEVWKYKIKSATGTVMEAEDRLLDIQTDLTNMQKNIDKIMAALNIPKG